MIPSFERVVTFKTVTHPSNKFSLFCFPKNTETIHLVSKRNIKTLINIPINTNFYKSKQVSISILNNLSICFHLNKNGLS